MSKWFQLIVRIPDARADELAAWFLGMDTLGVESIDADNPEPLTDLPAGWTELRASFEAGEPDRADQLLEALRIEIDRLDASGGQEPGPAAGLVWLDAQDWANNWKAHFSPVRVGRFLVHPGWEPADPSARWPIQIDPGLAFGTGMHPTTRLCLAALDEVLGAGRRLAVLDAGCGSGVLSIAAAMAGASPVVGVDTDPEAVRVTLQNAALNGQGDRIQVLEGGPAVVEARFDLVLANILSGTLIALRDTLVARLDPAGVLVLSGILASEAEQVAEAFAGENLQLTGRRDEDGWSALHFVRAGA